MKNNSEGIFNKIKRKGKALAGVAALASVISGSEKIKASNEFEQVKTPATAAEQVRQKEAQREAALALFQSGIDAQAMEGLKDKYEIEDSKKQVARLLLSSFALNLKLGFPEGEKSGNATTIKYEGTVYPEDVKIALRVLRDYVNVFIDKKFGDGNSKATEEERAKFKASFSQYPALKYLFDKIEGVDK